uniref:peptidoglycan-associated lipoprotein Pal n=1 Tax=Thaumasiovibrio occultus TaxID=1891184 RepID=UPI000B356C66|nr:peptidoglycan-associated lipoprotein Pal [Thaumasiovibrio occultus]
MQFNKVLKGLLIALPVLAMTACGSKGSDVNTGEGTTENTPVVTTPVEDNNGMTEEQIRNEALRQQQTVFFKFDNAEVDAEYAEMLEAHAVYLRANNKLSVQIEGHADERGTPEYNIALGERRANAVAQYLQALGVSPAQISIVSYGEEKPLVLGQSEGAYSKNRRAVLVY